MIAAVHFVEAGGRSLSHEEEALLAFYRASDGIGRALIRSTAERQAGEAQQGKTHAVLTLIDGGRAHA